MPLNTAPALADIVTHNAWVAQSTWAAAPPLARPRGRILSYDPFGPPAPPKPFRLIDAEDDAGDYLPDLAFSTGAEAADYARAERTKTGRKLRVAREVTPDEVNRGHERENCRLYDGTYARLPQWFPHRSRHYLHWAKDEAKRKAGWVAYSPTDRHLAEDRQVLILASRYLAKEQSHITPDEISRLTQRLLATFAPTEFKVTRDPAIGRLAYIGNAHCAESSDYPSCMRYPSAEYGLPEGRHPCDAYLGPNSTLSLAYTHVAGDPTQIMARAIVSERRKFYVRVYGYDEAARQTILAELEAAGYTRRSSFEGERLHLEPHPRNRGCVIVPYLDGDVQACDDDGNIDAGGGIDCEVTSGRSEARGGRARCECCGSRVHDDEGTTVGGEFWCDDCASEHAVYCERYGEYVQSYSATTTVRTRRGTQEWCEDAVDNHAFRCESTDEHYSSDYFTSIEVHTAAGLATWCRESTRGEWREDDAGDFWSVDDFPEGEDDDATDEAA